MVAPFDHAPPMYNASLTPVGTLNLKAALTPPPTLSDGLPESSEQPPAATVVVPDAPPQL